MSSSLHNYGTNALQLSPSKTCMSPFSTSSTWTNGDVASEPHFLHLDVQASTSSVPASAPKAVPVFVLPAPSSSPVVARMTLSDVLDASEGSTRPSRSTTPSVATSFDAAVAKLKESTASPKPAKPAPQPRRRSTRTKKATAAASAKEARSKKEPLFLPDPASPVSPLFLDFTGLPAPTDVPAAPPTPVSPAPKRKRSKASKPGHIPRPRNSFMIYRSAQIKALSEYVTPSGQRLPQSDLSRMIASMWREETLEVRERYARQAEEEKAEHYRRHPDYRYQPATSRKKAGDAKSSNLDKSQRSMVFPPSPPASVSSGFTTPSVLLPPLSISSSDDSASSGTPTTQLLSPFTPVMTADSLPTHSSAASEAWSIFRSTPMTWMEAPVDAGASWSSAVCERSAPEFTQPAFLDFSFALSPPFDSFVAGADVGDLALPTPPLAFEEVVVEGADNLVNQGLAAPASLDSPSCQQHFPLSPSLTSPLGCTGSPQDPFTLFGQ
ncbi:Proteophosphoglycan ppg4 [Rhodotorula toruloides ATCC 204091]|uniref:Proteophosphoglycan ppg4 n=1 Tax=Rhodotorula toruloides TaxID=5286 RepID=A0A0K3CC98_RHOTO|nr:Proteophosphoglycan ppg4 [Rhodotorula toruloides ATCC 204091]KAK4336391.1 Proteophosphoglycan ppg4 [Rhodotorula toruloides]PRQ74276.1 Proteophosphoglycan ppg4 [Rhodotorula toruloides]